MERDCMLVSECLEAFKSMVEEMSDDPRRLMDAIEEHLIHYNAQNDSLNVIDNVDGYLEC